MVKIKLDINGVPFYMDATWKIEILPAVGDIVIVDKQSIAPSERYELSKLPSNQVFKWADSENDSPALSNFDHDTEMLVRKRIWKYDAENAEMACILKVTFVCHEK